MVVLTDNFATRSKFSESLHGDLDCLQDAMPHRYVGNNPINMVDPDGLEAIPLQGPGLDFKRVKQGGKWRYYVEADGGWTLLPAQAFTTLGELNNALNSGVIEFTNSQAKTAAVSGFDPETKKGLFVYLSPGVRHDPTLFSAKLRENLRNQTLNAALAALNYVHPELGDAALAWASGKPGAFSNVVELALIGSAKNATYTWGAGKALGALGSLGSKLAERLPLAQLQKMSQSRIRDWAKANADDIERSLRKAQTSSDDLLKRNITNLHRLSPRIPLNPTVATDKLGRIVSSKATITPKNLFGGTAPTSAAQGAVQSVHPKAQAGHIFARMLGGLGGNTSKNIAPMHPNLNMGAFKEFEKQIAQHVLQGKTVEATITMSYAGTSNWPTKIIYRVVLPDGRVIRQPFNNPLPK